MDTSAKSLIAWGALAFSAGCGQAQPPPSEAAAQDDLLSATDFMRDFGAYVVYINALTTDQLTPDIAGEYGIVRSQNRAMLTISVHKKQANALPTAVSSRISGTAVNLSGQLKTVLMREIREAEAIYYIGELEVNDGETLIYTVDLTPDGESEPLSLRYQKQFFADD